MPSVIELGSGIAGKGVVMDFYGKWALFELDGRGAGEGGEDVQVCVFAFGFRPRSGELEEQKNVENN